ncbi:MAG: DUF4395 domain-containing protein [Actinomycetales bacterium]|nr:DUF4395 domain-containing protein [Actinomycetales bacterium]
MTASPASPTSTSTTPATSTRPAGIDPRGPRFGAGITAVIQLVVIALALLGATWPAFALFAAQALVFLWGATAGIARHPYGAVFRALVRPRLAPPEELEDPRPPTFAQGVGLLVSAVGILLFLVGVPLALPIAAAAAFVAAFLNAAFDVCLGCLLYVQLVRLRRTPAT